MAGCGAAELLARHVCAEPLPEHAGAFLLERYADPAYRALMPEIATGQL